MNLKLMMTGLDYKRSDIGVREIFAAAEKTAGKILAFFKDNGAAGCVAVSTCNRTELYASMPDGGAPLSETLCAALGRDFSEYGPHFTEREGVNVMKHLCRVASGLESQIAGDSQIITQTREALELSRGLRCADSYLETMFNISIRAAKIIKAKIIAGSLGTSSVPEKALEKIKTLCRRPLSGLNALVIGNGRIGRLAAELLIRENANVTVTLRSRKNGGVKIPTGAGVINYDERYKALENADIAVSATASPHLTVSRNELSALKRTPKIIADLAVPRDVEPSVKNIGGVTLFTIDDISCDGRYLPPESVMAAENIIAEHVAKYNRWLLFKENKTDAGGGGA